MTCLLCGAVDSYSVRSTRAVERESRLRARLVEKRLGHPPVGLEAKDLTQFMHGTPAEIVACVHCGMVRRNDEHPAQYESDRYDTALMRHLYPRYRDAFAGKREQFESLLPTGAEVLEVGSHLGAFLEVAEDWGWKPVGLDIGRDTSAFARSQGATVKEASLDDFSSTGHPDAIFIWNCFEQMDNPWDLMVRARSLLTHRGIVVLRVPNVEFYRHRQGNSLDWRRALSYNNLLGFPYSNGYNLSALKWLLASTDFQVISAFASSLLTPPYAEMNDRLREEWRQTRIETERRGAAHAPWIEIVGRAASLPNAN